VNVHVLQHPALEHLQRGVVAHQLVDGRLQQRAIRTQRTQLVRIANLDVLLTAHARGKGVLLLTGHFGNFEVATAAGIAAWARAQAQHRVTMLDALRGRRGLTGTKKGCDQDACGAWPEPESVNGVVS